MANIAVITGGSRGLGRDMAFNIAQRGSDVIITYLGNEHKAEGVVAEVSATGRRAAALQLDVSRPESFDGFVAELRQTLSHRFGSEQFNFLVNNAGIGIHAGFAETTEDQFDQLMNIHLKAPFFLTQKTLPYIEDGGAIINVSTGLARFALPGYDAYATMKGGVEVLTRYQAKALGARGIRANVIAPGAIETDFGGGAVRDNQDINAFVAGQTALGRAGRPDDIGAVAAFLCSDDAKWVNGQRIEASGGMFL